MVVTETDVAEGIKGVFDRSGLKAVVPGGLHYQFVPQGVAEPYAKLDIAEGEPEYNSSQTYIQSFVCTVSLWVWSHDGASNAGDLKRQFRRAFDRSNVVGKIAVPRADRVIDVVTVAPQGDGFVEEQSKQDQLGVLVSRTTLQVWIQATRR